MHNIDELEAFLLKHGENIVDMLGGEIDRIELKLKVSQFNLLVNPINRNNKLVINSLIII